MNPSKPRHPTFEELVALTIDELPSERATEVRDHLLECPACLAQARDLLRLPEAPPEKGQQIGGQEHAAAWARLSAALELSAPPTAPVFQLHRGEARDPVAPAAGKPRRRYFVALLAAAILGVVVGLAFDRALLPASPAEDQVASASTQLFPGGFHLRGEPEKVPAAKCPPHGGNYFFILTCTKTPAAAKTARVSMRSSTGELLGPWTLPITDYGQVEMRLAWTQISRGVYAIELSAEGGVPGQAEHFAVSVDCP